MKIVNNYNCQTSVGKTKVFTCREMKQIMQTVRSNKQRSLGKVTDFKYLTDVIMKLHVVRAMPVAASRGCITTIQ